MNSNKGGCFQCGETGHFRNNCPEVTGQIGERCYNCNHYGHIAKDCKEKKMTRCYRCSKGGHFAKNCSLSK